MRPSTRPSAPGSPRTLKAVGGSGKPGDVSKLSGTPATKAAVVLAAGVGKAGELDLESLRRAAGAAVRAANGVKTIALALPASTDEQVRAVVEGALLGGLHLRPLPGQEGGPRRRGRRTHGPGPYQVRRCSGCRGPDRGRGGELHPRPGQRSAERPLPAVIRGGAAGARQGAEVQGHRHGARREGAGDQGLRRPARRRQGLDPAAATRQARPTDRPGPRPTSPWSARGSPSTPAACRSRPATA